MSETVWIVAVIAIKFDRKSPNVLRISEIGEAISSAVSECDQIENVASVSIDSLELTNIRCQETNKETGQCELKKGHPTKHLGGYLMW